MTKEQLNEVLDKHKKWINDEPGGEGANLWGADLRVADLQEANLRGADLRVADLQEANLQEADLRGADLRGADLQEANLRGADLREADLQEANLRGAHLRVANLQGADLRGAHLQVADLRGADLRGANLWGADLREANLWGANLWGADLQGADNIPDYICPVCCPEKGSFIGFKKAYIRQTPVIVELEIPADAKRSSATNRKCRCNKAKVLSITDLSGVAEFQQAFSGYDNNFIYEVGKTVVVDDFDEDRWNECSTGIHFFITRDEAVNY